MDRKHKTCTINSRTADGSLLFASGAPTVSQFTAGRLINNDSEEWLISCATTNPMPAMTWSPRVIRVVERLNQQQLGVRDKPSGSRRVDYAPGIRGRYAPCRFGVPPLRIPGKAGAACGQAEHDGFLAQTRTSGWRLETEELATSYRPPMRVIDSSYPGPAGLTRSRAPCRRHASPAGTETR